MNFLKYLRYLLFSILLVISALILRINIKLHSENYTKAEKKADIILQLNFLETELKNNKLGDRMQHLFPEGFVFVNALYGLSWCELALSDSLNDANLKTKAIDEAIYAYREIDSEKAKWYFDKNLKPAYGIYYCGWKNYLLSKILSIDTTFREHKLYIDSFLIQCNRIKVALTSTENPYLQSYHNQSWPADMFVAMASLSNFDKIFDPRYTPDINLWLQRIKKRLDPSTDMVPHKVESDNGSPIERTRGCSMSLIIRMLAEINPEFAMQQFNLFKSDFYSTSMGLPSVREYPKGKTGYGDIDSGPVIFGVGFVATIVTVGNSAIDNCGNICDNIYKTINAFGFGYTSGNQKKYLLGKLPMADVFIAWGRASTLNNASDSLCNSGSWRIKFHMLSVFIIVLFWGIFYRKEIIKTANFKNNDRIRTKNTRPYKYPV